MIFFPLSVKIYNMTKGNTMTTTAPNPGYITGLLKRALHIYPATAKRYWYLAIVVAVTITLYYIYYVPGAVSPQLLPYYHMTFLYYIYLVVVGNAIAAFTAFIGGISDKVGRANMVIWGLLIVGLLQLVAIPNTTTKIGFSIESVAIGFVEGIILVATPALIRDFSPQLGRASAMGFWTLGPVMGSLAANIVATHTLGHLHPFQDQFIISGTVCIVMFVISFLGLKELAPNLRDQLMVTEREKILIEAKAKGVDIEKATSSPLKTMLKPDLIISSFGISVFLLIYYAAVAVFTLYFAVVYNFTTAQADGINTWYWAFDAGALVVFGILSDLLLVRKPFMLIGTLGSIVMTILFLSRVHQPHTTYYTFVVILSALAIFLAMTYAPWMAAYTEAVEEKNPALSAMGLAVWGWILRIVVAVSFLVLPFVVTTATPLVDNAAFAQKYGPIVQKFVSTHYNLVREVTSHQALFNQLAKYSNPADVPPALLDKAIKEVGISTLLEAKQYKQQLTLLAQVGPKLQQLQADKNYAPNEWERWWIVCIGGQVVFLVILFFLKGRWSPKKAKEDLAEHMKAVEKELKALNLV